jgi:hypothetical protein
LTLLKTGRRLSFATFGDCGMPRTTMREEAVA